MHEKMSAMTMRIRLSVRLPIRLLPNSLSNAVAVQEKATPIEISSPTDCMHATIVQAERKIKINIDYPEATPILPERERGNISASRAENQNKFGD